MKPTSKKRKVKALIEVFKIIKKNPHLLDLPLQAIPSKVTKKKQ